MSVNITSDISMSLEEKRKPNWMQIESWILDEDCENE